MKFKSAAAVIDTARDDLGEGEFFVYPSTFIREPDSYGDVVAKGAFSETIAKWKAAGAEKGHKLPGLFGHRMDDPDYFVAEATDMGEDEHGWWVRGRFDLDNPKAVQVYRLVKGGRLNQLSFAYSVRDESPVTLDGGRKANELRALDVYEFSFVPIGANQDTSVEAVKSATAAALGCVQAGQPLAPKHLAALKSARDALAAILGESEGSPEPSDDTEPQKTSGTAPTKSDPEASGSERAGDTDEREAPDLSVFEFGLALREREA